MWPKVGFEASVVISPAALNTQIAEIGFCPVEQGQITVARNRVKTHPFFDDGQSRQVA